LDTVVQVTLPEQFAIAVHAMHVPVPLPRYPESQAGQMSPVPFVTLHVSTDAQFAIVPQSVHRLLLSKVPLPQGVHAPVPSPT
jgi:hypothetical protein